MDKTIRLPGYEFALRHWLNARYDSRSEAVWFWIRKRLRISIGRGYGKCGHVTTGGMRCAGGPAHNGPHSFSNREWQRTRGHERESVDTEGGES